LKSLRWAFIYVQDPVTGKGLAIPRKDVMASRMYDGMTRKGMIMVPGQVGADIYWR